MPPDRTQLPPYPPPRVWSFPPPPVSRRWFWVALASAVTSAAAGIALVVAVVVLETADAPGLIDDPAVLSAIADECELMTTGVQSTDRGATPDRLAATIREENELVDAMIGSIGSLPSSMLAADRPTRAWLADWRRLVSARERFAASLVGEGARSDGFEIPRDAAGDPITVRMEDALLDPVCDVPESLLDPGQRTTSST